MAAVSVFVDDAVRGRLPLVCAKTGEPADLVIRIRKPVGGGVASIAWLLLFLGPPGWLAFFLVTILGSGQEYLTVRVPETEASYHREKQLEHFRLAAIVAGVIVPLYGLTVLRGMLPEMWLALGVTFLVAALALHVIVLQTERRHQPRRLPPVGDALRRAPRLRARGAGTGGRRHC